MPARGGSSCDRCRRNGRGSFRDILALAWGRAPRAAIRTDLLVAVPPLLAMPDSPAVSLALQLTGHNICLAAPFASEAGLFQQAGVPAVVAAPGRRARRISLMSSSPGHSFPIA